MIVLVFGLSYSEATITADIVSAAYDELKTFLNANGKYMGRMVRLSKYKVDTITAKNLNTFLQFFMTVLVMPAMVASIPVKMPIRV